MSIRFGAIAIVFAMLSGVVHAQKSADLWQGSFKTATTWGAMELTVSGEKPRLRLALDARLSEPEVTELQLTERRVSFVTTLMAVRYRFEGRRRREVWEGTLVSVTDPANRGSWRLSRLDPNSQSAEPLPAPTGKYPIGRVAFQWVGESRPELETRLPDDKRELLVYVFYPAVQSPGVPRAPYMPEVDAMAPYWKDDLTQRLKSFLSHNRGSVPVAKGGARFPVVIFAPGGGQKTIAYTTLLEDLASHGYVVAAIEPPYNAPAMQFPDGRIFGRLVPAERGWEEPKTRDDQPRIYEQMVLHWSRDMSFVLDRLVELNRAREGLLAGRLDVTRVGAFGHSRGGQAAGTVRLIDARFRGAINLDGNIRGRGFQPIKGGDGGQQPFMWIEKQMPTFSDQELEKMGLPRALYREFLSETPRMMESVRGRSVHVTISRPGIEHLDFSDNPFWSPSLPSDVRAGKRRTIEVTRAYVRAFFAGCLRGQWRELRALTADTGNAYPEVLSRTFGTMWAN
jgi:Chlorophyllase enzyme